MIRARDDVDRLLETLEGRPVTVMGLGLFGGGVGVVEFLARKGAHITVTDLRTEDALGESLDRIRDLSCRFVLGRHETEDFCHADLVIANPAVPRESEFLNAAIEAGVPIETEMSLFMRHCRARLLGVTGSNGKTTTTTLLASMLRTSFDQVFLGGNMGRSLLAEVEEISPEAIVVLELSSFQLEYLGERGLGPDGAVVLNLTPNHLDRHGTMEAYEDAKRQILAQAQWVVLNGRDPRLAKWQCRTAERIDFAKDHGREEAGFLLVKRGEAFERLIDVADVPLAGSFNRLNVLAAACAALRAGAEPQGVTRAIREFRPVAHRLECVGRTDSLNFWNDSVSTTPESTLAAIEALQDRPKVFLIGGYDKGCELDQLAEALSGRVDAVVLMGASAPRMHEAMRRAGSKPQCRVESASSFQEAFTRAIEVAPPGAAVVLSPAFPSYDWFRNFVDRGNRFREFVQGHVQSDSR